MNDKPYVVYRRVETEGAAKGWLENMRQILSKWQYLEGRPCLAHIFIGEDKLGIVYDIRTGKVYTPWMTFKS